MGLDQKALRETSVSGPLHQDAPRRATGAGSGMDADLLDGQSGAYYRSRTNHTDTQPASTISDFVEAVQDVIGLLLADQSGLDWNYNDAGNTLTLTVDAAAMRTLLDVWVNVSGDTMIGALLIAAALAGEPHLTLEETGASGTGGAVMRLKAPNPTGVHRLGIYGFGAVDGNGTFQRSAGITGNAGAAWTAGVDEETYIGIEITFDGETAPTETVRAQDKGFTLAQALCLPIRTSTAAPTTALKTDHTLLIDATAGAITVNLPAAATCSGRIYIVKKIDASANVVTLDGSGGELIDGAATQAIAAQWASLTVQSNGSAWYIL